MGFLPCYPALPHAATAPQGHWKPFLATLVRLFVVDVHQPGTIASRHFPNPVTWCIAMRGYGD
ncbi:hypothetical protein [Paraburkholderia sacchari]|uniref:hypothetical protein n=1 Tax=Paraburkholderia sacchari TaxID=159450 RepID=UPI0039A5DC11